MSLPRRPLGSSGLEITAVGFGSWAVGGGGWSFGWGPQDDDRSVDAIHRAVDLGVNWVDTAAIYGHGHSEEVVGRAVRALPAADRPLVFTKCGLVWDDARPMTPAREVVTPETVRKGVEDSLRRLGLDYLDLLQIHWPDGEGNPIEPAWAGDGQAARRGARPGRRRLQLRSGAPRAVRGHRSRGLAAAALLPHQPRRRAARAALGGARTAPASSATARWRAASSPTRSAPSASRRWRTTTGGAAKTRSTSRSWAATSRCATPFGPSPAATAPPSRRWPSPGCWRGPA